MPHHEYTEETQAKLNALQEVIEQQAKEIEALRGFAQAVLIDGPHGFDPERLPQIAVNFGLITTRRGTYGPSGNESPMTHSYKTSLLTGQ